MSSHEPGLAASAPKHRLMAALTPRSCRSSSMSCGFLLYESYVLYADVRTQTTRKDTHRSVGQDPATADCLHLHVLLYTTAWVGDCAISLVAALEETEVALSPVMEETRFYRRFCVLEWSITL